jgi:hypothetical protein
MCEAFTSSSFRSSPLTTPTSFTYLCIALSSRFICYKQKWGTWRKSESVGCKRSRTARSYLSDARTERFVFRARPSPLCASHNTLPLPMPTLLTHTCTQVLWFLALHNPRYRVCFCATIWLQCLWQPSQVIYFPFVFALSVIMNNSYRIHFPAFTSLSVGIPSLDQLIVCVRLVDPPVLAFSLS